MSNPSLEELDRAIAEVAARLGQLPSRPSSVRASGAHVTITLDAEGLLTDVEFPADRRPGLTALADELLELQDRAVAALASGQPAEGVELGEPQPATRAAHAIGRGAPQLPPVPNRDDLDQVAAELNARFERVRAGQGGESPGGQAASELVEVQVAACGLLNQIVFRDRARRAPAEQLASELVGTAAQARATLS